jgi:hypothetical protein
MPAEPVAAIAVTEKVSPFPKITLPGGYMAEDGVKPGDEVRALVTLRLGENPGEAEIVSVDGANYEEAAEEYPEEQEQVLAEEMPEKEVPVKDAFRDKIEAMMA